MKQTPCKAKFGLLIRLSDYHVSQSEYGHSESAINYSTHCTYALLQIHEGVLKYEKVNVKV